MSRTTRALPILACLGAAALGCNEVLGVDEWRETASSVATGTGGAGATGGGGDSAGGGSARGCGAPEPAPSWLLGYGSDTQESEPALAVSAAGDAYLAMGLTGPASLGGAALVPSGGSDIGIGMYSPAGAHLASARVGGAGAEVPKAIAAVGPDLVLAGDFDASFILGDIALSSLGTTDVFVARLSVDPIDDVDPA